MKVKPNKCILKIQRIDQTNVIEILYCLYFVFM